MPDTIPMNAKVVVRLPHGERYVGYAIGAVAGADAPMIQVRSGGGVAWIARRYVSLAPPPWGVRARRWVKSFLFGEA